MSERKEKVCLSAKKSKYERKEKVSLSAKKSKSERKEKVSLSAKKSKSERKEKVCLSAKKSKSERKEKVCLSAKIGQSRTTLEKKSFGNRKDCRYKVGVGRTCMAYLRGATSRETPQKGANRLLAPSPTPFDGIPFDGLPSDSIPAACSLLPPAGIASPAA